MAYTPSYTDSDISGAAIDGVVKILIAFSSLATLVGLIFLFGWMRKHVGKQ